MLTRKQRWRRVRGGSSGSRLFMDPILSSTGATVAVCSTIGRPPHPLDSLAIGDSLLHLLGSSSGLGDGRRVEDAEPPAPAPRSSVRFNHQVRVVLVPSRTELKNLKADMWWGEEDYYEFRREYIIAMRAAVASPSTDESDGRREEKDTDTEAEDEDEKDASSTPPPPTLLRKAMPADLCIPPPPPPPLGAADIPISTTTASRIHPCREFTACDSNKGVFGGAPGVVVSASISEDALAAAAAAASLTSADEALEQRCSRPVADAPFVGPAASVVKPSVVVAAGIDLLGRSTAGSSSTLPPRPGLPMPLRSCVSATAAAAAAAAAIALVACGAGEEPCRTQSMSSVSERTDVESSFSDSETEGTKEEEIEDEEDVDFCSARHDSPQARDTTTVNGGEGGRFCCLRNEGTLIHA